jgi:hypothetical protein
MQIKNWSIRQRLLRRGNTSWHRRVFCLVAGRQKPGDLIWINAQSGKRASLARPKRQEPAP